MEHKKDYESLIKGIPKGIETWWKRGGKYYIDENGFFRTEKSNTIEYYSPLGEDSFLPEFSKITDEKSLIEFANKFGKLNFANIYTAEDHNGIAEGKYKGNDVEILVLHAKAIRVCQNIMGIYKEHCLKNKECRKYHNNKTSVKMNYNPECEECYISDKLEKEMFKLIVHTKEQNFIEAPIVNKIVLSAFMNINNAPAMALHMVEKLINSNVKDIIVSYKLTLEGVMKPSFKAKCLTQFVWYALAQNIFNQMKSCEFCGAWFVPKHKDAKFCPPIYNQKYSKCQPSYRKKLKGYKEKN